jgi:ankyrin repeat protein
VKPEAFLLSCNYTKSDIADMEKEFPRILSLNVKTHLSPHVRFIVRTLVGGQGDICSGEECSIDASDDNFIPHNCKVSDLAKTAVPPVFFGRRLEKTIAPRHGYLVYYGLPHGQGLLENNGRLFGEFLEACDTPASNFAHLCNRWSIKNRQSGAPTYEALHTAETVEAFERASHRGLLAAASNKRTPELDLLGCTPGKMVDLLLQHGANAIEHDRFGASMLHWAGGTGNLHGTKALLKFLIEAGQGADAAEVLLYTQGAKDGATPMHWAACGVENGRFGVGGHTNICRLFLEEAGDRAAELVDVECYSGSTPLMWAAWSGSLDVVRLLVSHGADPHKKNRNECNVAHWATAGGNLEVCKYLKDELNVSFEEESIKCRKPLYHAVSYGHHDVAEWLTSRSDEDWREENWQISPEVVSGTVPNLE